VKDIQSRPQLPQLLRVCGLTLLLLAGVVGATLRVARTAGVGVAKAAAPGAPDSTGIHFVDVTRQAGINFVHNTGAFGKKYLPETMGPGCAFLDYDNDGYPDILLVNGADFPGHKTRRSTLKL
jgi:hypothetical protein